MQILRSKGDPLLLALGLVVLTLPTLGQDKPKARTTDVLESIRNGDAKGGQAGKGGLKPVEGLKSAKEKLENGGQPPLTTRPGGMTVEKKPALEGVAAGGEVGQSEGAQAGEKAAERGAEAAPKPAPGKPEAESPGGPNARALMQRLGTAVRVHEVRMARMDALAAVFEGKGESAKLSRVTDLRKREDERYQLELATFKTALGEETYRKVLAGLRITRKGADLQKGKPSVDMREARTGGEPTPKQDDALRGPTKERGAPAPVERKKEGGR